MIRKHFMAMARADQGLPRLFTDDDPPPEPYGGFIHPFYWVAEAMWALREFHILPDQWLALDATWRYDLLRYSTLLGQARDLVNES